MPGAVGRAVGGAIRRTICRAVGRAVCGTVRRAVCGAVRRTICGAVRRTICGAVGRAVCGTVGRTGARAVSRARSRTIGRAGTRAVSRAVGRACSRAVARTVGRACSRAVGRAGTRAVARARSRTIGRAGTRAVSRAVGRACSRAVARTVGRACSRAVGRARAGAVSRVRDVEDDRVFAFRHVVDVHVPGDVRDHRAGTAVGERDRTGDAFHRLAVVAAHDVEVDGGEARPVARAIAVGRAAAAAVAAGEEERVAALGNVVEADVPEGVGDDVDLAAVGELDVADQADHRLVGRGVQQHHVDEGERRLGLEDLDGVVALVDLVDVDVPVAARGGVDRVLARDVDLDLRVGNRVPIVVLQDEVDELRRGAGLVGVAAAVAARAGRIGLVVGRLIVDVVVRRVAPFVARDVEDDVVASGVVVVLGLGDDVVARVDADLLDVHHRAGLDGRVTADLDLGGDELHLRLGQRSARGGVSVGLVEHLRFGERALALLRAEADHVDAGLAARHRPELLALGRVPLEPRLAARVPGEDLDLRERLAEVRHRQERLDLLAEGEDAVVAVREVRTLEVEVVALDPEQVALLLGDAAQERIVALVGLEAERGDRVGAVALAGVRRETSAVGDLLDHRERRRVGIRLGLGAAHQPVRLVHPAQDEHDRAVALELAAPGGDFPLEDGLELAH